MQPSKVDPRLTKQARRAAGSSEFSQASQKPQPSHLSETLFGPQLHNNAKNENHTEVLDGPQGKLAADSISHKLQVSHLVCL